MNTRPAIEETSAPPALSAAFNSDASCFAVGLDKGFCIYITNTCQLKQGRGFNGGFGIVQMMGSSNMIALVGGGKNPMYAPNKVIIWDDHKSEFVAEISGLRNTVRGAQITRTRVAIAMQNRVQLYTLTKKPRVLASYETANNLLGICCMTDKLLAFPGRTDGQLQLVHLATDSVSIIPAHESSLQTISLSADGEYIASASERGTLINVFATTSGAKLAVFRRGADFATIFSLAFSPSGSILACTSDKLTLHLFDVGKYTSATSSRSEETPENQSPGKWGMLSRLPLMPRLFSDEYSFVSCPFEVGVESLVGGLPASQAPTLGTSRPAKGLIGWIDDAKLVVIGAGRDARWEKFMFTPGRLEEAPKLAREGWKRYMSNA